METISSLAGAATKAIWGEENGTSNTQEPISGEKGKGTLNEPYDRGNEENVDPHHSSSSTRPEQKNQGADRPDDKPGPQDTEAIKLKKGQAENEQDDSKPHVPHTDEEREKAMEVGEFPRDPNDHSGEPLKMHDEVGKKDRSASVSQEGGNPHGKKHGTGEEYVKTSGMAADGGDFDATKPGAGKEANRLMEEKGVPKTSDDVFAKSEPAVESSPSPSEKAGKPSKMNRLKEKLHINKHH